MFVEMLVLWHVYHVTEAVEAEAGSIRVVGVLPRALLHSACNLESTLSNSGLYALQV